MVRSREAEEAERQAMRKEVADRMYEKVKKEMEEEAARREEEEELINLLRQEELEEKRRLEEEAVRRKAEQMRADMIAANQYQMRLKVCRAGAGRAAHGSEGCMGWQCVAAMRGACVLLPPLCTVCVG